MPRTIGSVVYGVVDHFPVHTLPEDSGRAVDQGLDEELCVDFVDVVLVDDGIIKTAERRGDPRWKLRLTHVKNPREDSSRKRHQYREAHEREFRAVIGPFGRGFGCCSE